MNRIFTVVVDHCVACGKCELACAFAHGSEGRPARSRINIYRRGGEPILLGIEDRLLRSHVLSMKTTEHLRHSIVD